MRKDFDGGDDWTSPGAFEVSPDLFRIPLPLPNDGLRAVNVYAILDDAGVGLIDSGWAIPEARAQLEGALALLDRGVGDIHRILMTHVHRDHYTHAVILRREFGVRVALGENEKPSLESLIAMRGGQAMARFTEMEQNGAGEIIDAARVIYRAEGSSTPWELPDEWLSPGRVELGGRILDAVATPGHTVGHLVFHDEPRAQLFAGDHILPTITPSIGFEARLMVNPLRDFMDSLATVRAMPDARLLPAHGPVAASTHTRIDELLAHHAVRLDATEAAVHGGATTPYEVARVLRWTRRLRHLDEMDIFNKMLAVNETAAHLMMLVSQGRCSMTMEDGIRRFR